MVMMEIASLVSQSQVSAAVVARGLGAAPARLEQDECDPAKPALLDRPNTEIHKEHMKYIRIHMKYTNIINQIEPIGDQLVTQDQKKNPHKQRLPAENSTWFFQI